MIIFPSEKKLVSMLSLEDSRELLLSLFTDQGEDNKPSNLPPRAKKVYEIIITKNDEFWDVNSIN